MGIEEPMAPMLILYDERLMPIPGYAHINVGLDLFRRIYVFAGRKNFRHNA